ncbi:ABC-type transport auxiliary lipoprotein family protein [Seohaeicola saemankumensis]|uniref:ABC-type transport auxiliary lipoprotein family protein n=1 Tax=Seohaeicola saemankumensis TaxID=481181 RepID=A0ABW3TD22_9RHOB
MTLIRTALPAVFALTLAGCSALSSLTDATTPLDAFELRAPVALPAVQGSVRRDLVIETPTAGGALDTDRIMIRPGPFQAQYLPGARWTDTAPVMLQNLMLRSFEDTNALRYVGRRPLGGTGDYVLVSELTDFQAELAAEGQAVTTRVRLTARLVRESDASVIGSRTVQTTAQAASTDTLAVVESFDQATGAALQDLAGWALRLIGVRFTS